jgi:uncharacterized protein YxeA
MKTLIVLVLLVVAAVGCATYVYHDGRPYHHHQYHHRGR